MEWIVALIALTAMEIVLGIDNIVFIAILTDKLPAEQRSGARRAGLALALVSRLLLLASLSFILGLTEPVFSLTQIGIPKEWLADEVNELSIRDLILLLGGLFLIANSTREIHAKIEGHGDHHQAPERVSYWGVLAQIAVLDIVFSLDSVITAVGMSNHIWVMVTAVIAAICVMLVFADSISNFVSRHATLKVLALSFLILIGVMLVAEGIGTHINKGYIYFAMAFSLVVEMINLRIKTRKKSPQAA